VKETRFSSGPVEKRGDCVGQGKKVAKEDIRLSEASKAMQWMNSCQFSHMRRNEHKELRYDGEHAPKQELSQQNNC
jgi:hypothetical protein